MIKKIPKLAVYAIIFLLPLFSLPFTANALDFQKQFLLLGLAGIGMFFWIWNVISAKKLEFNQSPINIFLVALVVLVFVSSQFSLYPYGSFWGTPLPVFESFISILGFFLFYLLIANNFKKEDIAKLIAVGAASAGLALIYAVAQLLGGHLPFLPEYAKNPSFNTIGNINSLGTFGAIIFAAVWCLFFLPQKKYRILFIICGLIILLALVFFNGAITMIMPGETAGSYDLLLAPWIAIALSCFAVFVLPVGNEKFFNKKSKIKNAAFLMLVLAMFFLAFNFFAKNTVSQWYSGTGMEESGGVYGFVGIKTAIDGASLDWRTAAQIALDTLKNSPQNFLIGSGPGTFIYDFNRYKPVSMSNGFAPLNMAFFSANSEIINKVATTGLFGLIALMAVMIAFTIKGYKNIEISGEDVSFPLAAFGGWLAVVCAIFFLPFNISLAMLFWLFLGLIAIAGNERKKTIELNSGKTAGAVYLLFVFIAAAGLLLAVWGFKRYSAEVDYRQALIFWQKNDLTAAIIKLKEAAALTNKMQDNYLNSLSQVYLAKAAQELDKQNISAQNAFQSAAPYLRDSVAAADYAADFANPNNWENWAARGNLYRQLFGFGNEFAANVINIYQKSLDLNPNNPELLVQIGQAHIAKKDYARARAVFVKAIEIRPQYLDPHYYLALIADVQGDKQAAIAELNIIMQYLPENDQELRRNIAKMIEVLQSGGALNSQNYSQNQPVLAPNQNSNR